MKKQTNKRFLAKKWSLFGVFIFAMLIFSDGVFAAGDCGNINVQSSCVSESCYWDDDNSECLEAAYGECKEKQTWAGCTLKAECSWDSGKSDDSDDGVCKPKSSKYQARAIGKWEVDDCNDMISGTDITNGTFRYLQTGEKNENQKVDYEINGEIKEGINMDEACVDLVENGTGHPCDYRKWLTDAGKRKCSGYYRLMSKAVTQLCLEKVENIWQNSIKNEVARMKREDQRAQCKGIGYDYYEGPVFSGPGLRGGSQMAQMELSNSISKQRDLTKLIIDWASFILEIAAVLAVIAIMWGGVRYITDMGDGAGIEAAKKIIIWTVVGLILILSSYALVNTVMKAGHGAVSTINNTLKT